jgi:uncharacterized protein (DUF697 family)
MAIGEKSKAVVRNRVLAAAASGLAIGPGTDIPILIGIWAEGTIRLAAVHDVTIDSDQASRLVGAIFAGGANWMVSGFAIDVLTVWIPGVNVAANGAVNAFYTFSYLRAVADLFEGSAAPGGVILENGMSLIVSGLSSHAPHVIARDLAELANLLA